MPEANQPSSRVKRLFRLFQFLLYSALLLMLGGVVVLKVQPVRELFWPWLPIYLQEPGHEHTGHFYRYDQRLGWRNVAGWKATTLDQVLTINSRGLRDREYPYTKPVGTRRLLVLGDSFTWGYGVADDEIFTEVLERRFQEKRQPWEVLNTGVSGWSTDQEYLFLVDEGFRYQPDLVVLAFYTFNDPKEVIASEQYGLSKPVFLDRKLTLANVPVPRPSQPPSGLKSTVDPFELVVTLIEAMARECRKHNCRLVVMKFGTFADPEHKGLIEAGRLFEEAFARLDGVPYLDLDKEFKRLNLKTRDLVAGNEDNHWNDYGHRKVAGILGDFLDERGLLQVSGQDAGQGIDEGEDVGQAPRPSTPCADLPESDL